MNVPPAVLGFYAERDEASRLTTLEANVERVRVRRLLAPRLPAAPAQILDVGGGPGAHASWLVGRGHHVHLIDVVEDHVTQARAVGLDATVGDARHLDATDDSVDVVLLLGPLYHLHTAGDRAAALAEARRVLMPGGLLVVTAVTRASIVLDQLRAGGLADAEIREAVADVVARGAAPPVGDPVFHCHTVEGLRAELAAADFTVDAVHGVEGPGWPLLPPDAAPDHPLLVQLVEVAELLDGDAAVAGASAHLLAFAHA